jgi:hypothetical protein
MAHERDVAWRLAITGIIKGALDGTKEVLAAEGGDHRGVGVATMTIIAVAMMELVKYGPDDTKVVMNAVAKAMDDLNQNLDAMRAARDGQGTKA